jgi:protease-4
MDYINDENNKEKKVQPTDNNSPDNNDNVQQENAKQSSPAENVNERPIDGHIHGTGPNGVGSGHASPARPAQPNRQQYNATAHPNRQQYNAMPQQPQNAYYYQPGSQPNRSSSKFADGVGTFFKGLWQITKYVFFGFSVLGNLVLLLIIIAIIAAGYSSYKGGSGGFSAFKQARGEEYSEFLIQQGTSHERIVIVDVAGIITAETSEYLRQQFDIIYRDPTIRGIIVRIDSPGGSVVASDQLYHMIQKLSEEKRVPIMAYMAGLAASGGYYTAIACDRIIAEPTTITGSIGVIMQTFTMKQLFEEKLGVQPVTVKSGEKKDWPNSFKDVTPEQRQYIDEKLIKPAYNRFVDLVDKGRPLLSREQVVPLADGSIYYAQEAMDNGLIDQVGYIEDAIKTLSDQANLSDPQVFGYQKVYGLSDLLQMKADHNADMLSTGKELISEMQSPKLMYLWQMQ